jgi:flagellar biosynthesis/type III secretory pathway protein FliH
MVATGVVLALLAGFFIGRGSRLSNSDVQSKVTQQAQAGQIAEQQTLSAQKAADQTAMDTAVVQAQKNGETAGLREGRTEGYQQGQTAGQAQGFQQGQSSGQAQGFQQGQQQGYNQGQSSGYNQGFNSGVCATSDLIC